MVAADKKNREYPGIRTTYQSNQELSGARVARLGQIEL